MVAAVHLDGPTVFRLAPLPDVVRALHEPADGEFTGAADGTVYRLHRAGHEIATIDLAALTARRAPAVSALATEVLALPEVTGLAVFGTGVQAREHLRAMRWVRPSIERIDVVGRDRVNTDRFVAMLRGEGLPVRAADRTDASSAELICTCTTSPQPVVDEHAIKPGAHVNAIDTTRAVHPAARVVDETALPDLAAGRVTRTSADEITMFVALGTGPADLQLATLLTRRAELT